MDTGILSSLVAECIQLLHSIHFPPKVMEIKLEGNEIRKNVGT